jgi:PAS domain S-box-containing protein
LNALRLDIKPDVKRDAAALTLLLLIVLLFFWPLLFAGRWVPRGGGDLVSFLWPMYRFAARSLRAGVVPLWNPHLYSGAPFIADNQSGALYPINLLAFALFGQPSYGVMEGLVVLHIWLAGAGAFVLTRGLGRRRAAALFGGVAFALSDLFVTHVGNLNLNATAAWLPWLLYLTHRALTGGGPGWAAGAGAVLAVSALAGHGQMLLFLGLTFVLYLLYRLAADWRRGPRHGPRTLALAGLVLAVGVGGAALTLLPAWEMAAHTGRGHLPYDEATRYSLPPRALVGLLAPGFYGRGPAGFWGAWERVEVGYAGVATLVLAAVGLTAGLRSRPTQHAPRTTQHATLLLFLALLALLALLLALGRHAPFYRLVYRFAPVFDQVRAPARLILLTDLGLATLAAGGLDRLLRGEGRLRASQGWAVWIGLGALAAAGALLAVGLPQARALPPPDRVPQATASVVVAAALLGLSGSLVAWLARSPRATRHRRWAGWLFVGLLAADLIGLGSTLEIEPHDPTLGFHHDDVVAFLRQDPGLFRIEGAAAAWQPDAALVHALYDVGGIYNPLELAPYQAYRWAVGERGAPLYNLLGAKYVLADAGHPPGDERLVPAYTENPEIDVYLNTAALPRALLVPHARVVPDHAAAWEAIHAPGFDPTQTVVLERGQVEEGELGSVGGESQGEGDSFISFVRYGLNQVELAVRAPTGGWLVLSDVYYPGWRATVDGAPAPLLRADYVFRAVPLPPGEHAIRMTFAPWTWRVGLAVSVLTWSGLVVWMKGGTSMFNKIRQWGQRLRQQLAGRERAQQALQRRNRELAARNAVAKALSSSLDLQDVLSQALLAAVDALEFAGGLVTLADERTGKLVLAAHRGVPQALVEQLEAGGMEGTLCGFVYQRGEHLSLEDLRQGALVPADVNGLLQVGLQAYAGVPIVHQDRILGTLCLFDVVPHLIGETERDLLAALGQQIGMAVENARLFRDAVREREVAQTLLDTAEALSMTLRVDRLLARILDELQRVVPYDAASINMVSEASRPGGQGTGDGSRVVWAVASRGPEHVPSGRCPLEELPLVQRVVRGRSPVIVSNVCQEGAGEDGSWLGVPMVYRGEMVGLLIVESARPGMYDEAAARLASAFARQAALAIENSRLYEETQARLREVNLLYGVATAFSSTLDMDRILPYAARSLCEMLNGTGAEVYDLSDAADAVTVAAKYVVPGATEGEALVALGQTYALTDLPATAEAVNQRRPVQVQVDDPEADPRERAVLEARGAWAVLLLPIVVRNRVLGLAKVWDCQGSRHFTKGEIALGQTLIYQAAVAMENARLYQESEERRLYLESVLAAAPDAIVTLDADHRIVEWNPGAARLFGYAREDVLGQDIDPLITDPDTFGQAIDFTRVVMSGTSLSPMETVRYRRDGSPIDVILAGSPVLAGDEFVGAVAVYTDITELKRVEEALRQRTVELQARNEELDAFSHTVAHDLKGPLSNIAGFAEVLETVHTTMSDEELEDYLSTITQIGFKMVNVIDALLLLAGVRKMEHLHVEPLDMARIVDDVQQRLAYMVREHRAEVSLPETWPVALGYGPWVEEVWVNYLSNALKYGGRPPHMELGATERADGMVRFWVRDNGPGISPQAQARLFTPFTRLDQVRVKGYGLGLSIVRRIVEKLGGQVGVESEIGQGSIFSFTLPGGSAVASVS